MFTVRNKPILAQMLRISISKIVEGQQIITERLNNIKEMVEKHGRFDFISTQCVKINGNN